MNLLLIANVFPPVVGGSAEVYSNLCRWVDGNVVVLAPRRDYQTGLPIENYESSDASQNFTVSRIDLLRSPLRSSPRFSILGSAWRYASEDIPLRMNIWRDVQQLFKLSQPDIVCLGELHALSWLGTKLQKHGTPVLQFVHGEEITMRVSSKRLREETTAALTRIDGVIAVSTFTRQKLIEMGVLEDRIHLLQNGVDSDRFRPGPKNESIIASLGLENKKVLLTVSRVEEKKGHDNVLRALPQIIANQPDIVYVIVGTGPHEAALRSLAKQTGVEEYVRFVGRVSKELLPEYYRTCDIFIMPNRKLPNGDTEGFGLVFLEAGSCCKPVIAGRDGGTVDAVTHNETGLVVDGESVTQIGASALQLLSNSELAARLAVAGRRRAIQSNWNSKGLMFSNICSEVLAHCKRPMRTS